MQDLATFLLIYGRKEEANLIYEEAGELGQTISEAENQEESPIQKSAEELIDDKKYDEVFKIVNDNYNKQKELCGENHPDTIEAKNIYVSFFHNTKKYEEALKMRKELYEESKRVLGEDHPHTWTIYNNLAYDYEALNKYEEALEIAKTIFKHLKEKNGIYDVQTTRIILLLSSFYQSLGKEKEANIFKQLLWGIANIKSIKVTKIKGGKNPFENE